MSLGLINEPAFRRWLPMPTFSDRSRIIWIYMTKGAETLSEMLRFKEQKDGRCLKHVNYSNISGKKILIILLLTEILCSSAVLQPA
jgi:hypothetical protein